MDIDISKLDRLELEKLQDEIQARLKNFNEDDFEEKAKAIIVELIQLAKEYPFSGIYFLGKGANIDFLSPDPNNYEYLY